LKLVTFFGLWFVCVVCQAEIYAFEGMLTVQRYVGLGCEKAGIAPGSQYEMTVGFETLGDSWG
jgi:hypothetical protein